TWPPRGSPGTSAAPSAWSAPTCPAAGSPDYSSALPRPPSPARRRSGPRPDSTPPGDPRRRAEHGIDGRGRQAPGPPGLDGRGRRRVVDIDPRQAVPESAIARRVGADQVPHDPVPRGPRAEDLEPDEPVPRDQVAARPGRADDVAGGAVDEDAVVDVGQATRP